MALYFSDCASEITGTDPADHFTFLLDHCDKQYAARALVDRPGTLMAGVFATQRHHTEIYFKTELIRSASAALKKGHSPASLARACVRLLPQLFELFCDCNGLSETDERALFNAAVAETFQAAYH